MPETVRCAGERGLDLTSRLLSEASADDELFASARPRQSVRMPSALGSALGVSTTCALAISPFISSGCRDSADRRSGRIGSAGDTWPLRKGNRCRVPLAPVVQLDTERRLERAAVSTSARSRRPFACRRFGSDQQADDSVGRPGRGGSSERETATLAVQPAPDARAEPPQTFPFPDPSLQARKQHAQRYTPAVTRPRRFALASAVVQGGKRARTNPTAPIYAAISTSSGGIGSAGETCTEEGNDARRAAHADSYRRAMGRLRTAG